MRESIPKGIKIISVIFITSSLIQMHALLNFEWYKEVYRYLPHQLMITRYCFSWAQRILGLSAAIGILYLNNFSRKILLCISIFSILALYWKHPFIAFQYHTEYLDRELGFLFSHTGLPHISFSSLVLPSLIVQDLSDILFNGVVIYYLTRPKVKAMFKKS